MSKETELKYSIESPALGREILKSNLIEEMLVAGSTQRVEMKAIYYDDKDLTLTSRKIGYRVRKENDTLVATVKWAKTQNDSGLSVRHEYNVDVTSETADPKVFNGIIEDREILSALISIDPMPLFTTEFARELVLIKYKGSLIEVAFDLGKIYTEAGKNLPICELECELKEGTEADLVEFGFMISDKAHLSPMSDSKLKRGLSLL